MSHTPHRCIYAHCWMKVKWFGGTVLPWNFKLLNSFRDYGLYSGILRYVLIFLDISFHKDLLMSSCRTWWTRMHSWMLKIWRSLTRLRSERLHVEKQELRRKPARTGEKAWRRLASLCLEKLSFHLMHTNDCLWTLKLDNICHPVIIVITDCVWSCLGEARAALRRSWSWSRRAELLRKPVNRNPPVEM